MNGKLIATVLVCLVVGLGIGFAIGFAYIHNQYTQLEGDYATLNSEFTQLEQHYTGLNNTYTALLSNYSSLHNEYTQLQGNYANLNEDYNNLNTAYDDLNATYTELKADYDSLIPVTYYTVDDRLNITDLRVVEEYWTTYVRGNVTNIGDKPINYVYVYIILRNPDGTSDFSSSYYERLENLYIGETMGFSISVYLEEGQTFEVLLIY